MAWPTWQHRCPAVVAAAAREIEDIAALISAASGSACVFGYSTGATLALKAAASGLPVTKLVLYEPPFRTDDGHTAAALRSCVRPRVLFFRIMQVLEQFCA